MENVQAWLKAHWKPFIIAVAAGVVVWFLFMRKKSNGGTVLTLPGMTGGSSSSGAAGGPAADSAAPAPAAPASAAASAAPLSFNQWLQKTWNPSYLTQGHGGLNQWINDLIATYEQQTGVSRDNAAVAGVPSYEWFKGQYAVGGWRPPAAPPAGVRPPAARGSGFRGGDVYPPFAGPDARAIPARVATGARLPAAPLGTPMRAKQPLSTDVRRANRRETAVAEISRAQSPVPLPQSFSVPIREHQEATRPILAFQAQSPVNATQAGGGELQTDAPTGVEQASAQQKATIPPPIALAAPNVARGRRRMGPMRPLPQARQRWGN